MKCVQESESTPLGSCGAYLAVGKAGVPTSTIAVRCFPCRSDLQATAGTGFFFPCSFYGVFCSSGTVESLRLEIHFLTISYNSLLSSYSVYFSFSVRKALWNTNGSKT